MSINFSNIFSVKNNSDKYLSLILLVGVILRIYKLGSESYYGDEGFSIKLASNDLFGTIVGTALDFHPPLYYILLNIWTDVFGYSEFATRLLSVTISMLSIILVYKLGKKIFNTRVGLLGSSFMALSSYHVYISQEARMYSLLGLLSITSYYYFFDLIREDRAFWKYSISSLLLIYTHYHGVFVILSQLVIFVYYNMRVDKNMRQLLSDDWTKSQLIIGIGYLPWIPIVLGQIFKQFVVFSSQNQNNSSLYEIVVNTFAQIGGIRPAVDSILISSLLTIMIIMYLSLSFMKKIRNNSSKSDINLYSSLGIWVLITVFVPIFLYYIEILKYKPKYVVAGTVPLYLMISKDILEMNKKKLSSLLVVMVILVSAFSLGFHYSTTTNPEYNKASTYLSENTDQSTFILFDRFFNVEMFDLYNDEKNLRTFSYQYINTNTTYSSIQTGEDLWLWIGTNSTKGQDLMNKLNESHYIADSKEFEDIRLVNYKLSNDSNTTSDLPLLQSLPQKSNAVVISVLGNELPIDFSSKELGVNDYDSYNNVWIISTGGNITENISEETEYCTTAESGLFILDFHRLSYNRNKQC